MGGKEKYLKSIEAEEKELSTRESALAKRKEFYTNCHLFSDEDMENVLRYIVPMISKVEGTEYVDHVFSIAENDHYETEWVSPYEGQYGVSGAELAATAKPRERLVHGQSFRTRMIIDKATCDMFGLLSFSTCHDYRSNLARILTTKKYFEIKPIVVTKTKHFEFKEICLKAELFSSMFPYVSDFLTRLTDWRLENGIEEIPEEVLASIAESVTAETLSKDKKGPVKIAEKNNN